jgi:predicted Fe-Mo cluster-binding NifX family protein
MNIILTTVLPKIESEVDPRFGRCAYFLIVNTETLEWQAHSNPAGRSTGGAGIRAAQFVSEQKVDAVLSGDFGPNAYTALEQAGVSMYVYGDCQTALEAIKVFNDGDLKQIGGPTRQKFQSQGNRFP